MFDDVLIRLRNLIRRKRAESELEDEVRFHFERQVEKCIREGLTLNEATRRARLMFGGVEQIKEECRDARGLRILDTLLQDIRYGLRMLRRNPVFTAVAVLTLALGVGVNTAIFSIVNAVLLRPLPFHDPDRLVRIVFNNPGLALRDVPFSVPELEDLRNRAGVFEEVAPAMGASVNLTGAKHPERLEMLGTTFNYFLMLGITPEIGRLFGPQDNTLSFSGSVVISDGLWRRSYGADPGVLGRSLRLDNDVYTIVGVLPPGFHHPGQTIAGDIDLWLPTGFRADPFPKPTRDARVIPVAIGRLKPGLTMAQAQARLTAMAAELRLDFPSDYPSRAKWTIELQSLQESLVGNVRPMLLVLFGAVVMIVLLVSLNIANLLLARSSGRQQEMAVRTALGASRGRMISQMLTESALLALIGGAGGVAAAVGSSSVLQRFVPSNIPRLSELSIDWVVLVFSLTLSLLTGLLFGLAPAIQSSRPDLSPAVREGARGSGYSLRTVRLRDVLIASELAIAVVLMVGAGLLLRTLRDLLEVSPGFNPTQVVTANIWLPVPNDPQKDPYLKASQQTVFNRELLRRMSAIPGVQLAGVTSSLPTTSQTFNGALDIDDRAAGSSQDLSAEFIRVSPDYFRVMQAPLVRGRFFTEGDEDGQPPVAMIDEATAGRYWAGRDPLGRRLRFGQNPARKWLTVVGVVKDIKHDGLEVDGVPHVYVSINQVPGRTLSVVLRTSLPANRLEPEIRREIQGIDPGLPVFHVTPMNEVIDESLASRRFSADLVGGFAGMAMLLASIGIYGLLAYMVGQRSREIGLRIALGARRDDILELVLGRGVRLAAVGIAVGLMVAFATASLMASLLYGVRPHDPAIFLTVPLLLLLVTALASYIPAWRATKVDPVVALRET